jgi:hypothetical protein
MALRLRLHLGRGEGQLYTRCQRANLLAPVLEEVNYEPYALFATHDKEGVSYGSSKGVASEVDAWSKPTKPNETLPAQLLSFGWLGARFA